MSAPGLAELQLAFAAWLRDPGQVPPAGLLRWLAGPPELASEGLEVYRRSSRHAQRGALEAAFPVLAALVGPELFAALSADHLRHPGSRSGDLHQFGAGMAATVRAEPACGDLPYLADVAELEWAVHRSQFVGEGGAGQDTGEACVDPAQVAPGDLHRLRLLLAPGVLLLALATPAGRIWRAHQPQAVEPLAAIDPAAGPEWLAVRRVSAGVCVDELQPAEFDLLRDGRDGLTLARSLDRLAVSSAPALAASPPDLAAWLPRWLRLGLVRGLALAPG